MATAKKDPAQQVATDERGRVRVVGPDGAGTVSREEFARGLPQGYKAETIGEFVSRKEQAEFETAGEQIKTAAIGAAEGATMGLSTAGLVEAGVVDPARQRKREQYNQWLSLASEIGGSALGLVGTGGAGGAGALARIGRAATAPARGAFRLGAAAERAAVSGLGKAGLKTEGALARAGGYAAGGATEGAFFGAGQALSEEALSGGNYDGLAEKLWAGAKEGATFGALTGGALGGTIGLTGKAAQKIAKRIPDDFRGMAAREAEQSAVQAIAVGKREVRELVNTKRLEKTGRRLLDDDIVAAGRSGEDMLGRARVVKEQRAEEIGGLLQKIDDAGARVDAGVALKKLDDVVEKLEKTKSPEHHRAARRVRNQTKLIRDMVDSGEGATHTELHRARVEVDETIRNWGARGDTVASQALKDARRAIESGLETSAEKSAKELGEAGWKEAYRNAKESYGAAAWAEKNLFEQVEVSSVSRSALGLTDNLHMLGGLAAGGPAGAVASTVASKFMREHGRTIAADLLNRASRVDGQVEKSLRRFFKRSGEVKRPAIAGGANYSVDQTLGKRAKETRADAFRRVARTVQSAEPPQRMAVDIAAPKTGQAARAVAQRGLSFLKSKLPTPEHPENPFYDPPEPHPDEIARFSRYLKAVRSPLSVLDSLEDGTLTSEEAEAVRTVYPGLYESMRRRATGMIVEEKRKISYPDRIQLGVLLDLPLDPSLDPESMRITQGAMAPDAAAEQQKDAPSGPGPAAKPLADEFETEAQRLEQQEFAI